MSGAAAADAGTAPRPQTLDEVMLAMDVVDTIRHRELLVERELTQGTRDEELRNRLREIYHGQGIEVSDHVIDEAIKALKEERFVYTPPRPGLQVTLAKLWVRRQRIARWAAGIAAAILLAWAAYYFAVERPRILSAERARVELTQTLPQSLQTAYASVIREAKVEAARAEAAAILADGRNALAQGDAEGARVAVNSLNGLHDRLVQTYTLRIVSGPGRDSGVYRIPEANPAGRNYYLIVEAVDPRGRVVPMDIASEEDNKVTNVRSWGVRVSPETFEAVRRDKQDDGIIQNRIVGQKERGQLNMQYSMPVLGGTITDWR